MAMMRRVIGESRPKQIAGGLPDQNGEVARIAYELYEQRGRVDGYALEDWLHAERIIQQRSKTQ